jgi:hypothetical protein
VSSAGTGGTPTGGGSGTGTEGGAGTGTEGGAGTGTEGGAGTGTEGGAGTGTEGGAGTAGRRACDGSADLRFAAAIPWNGGVPEAVGVLYELGVAYVFVTGQCKYVTWNNDPRVTSHGDWSAARAGSLSASLEQQLMDDFDYASWPEKSGAFGPDYSIADAPSLLLFDGSTRLACHKPCEMSAPKLSRALEGMTNWTKQLYGLGQDLDGEMRFRAFEVARPPRLELGAWPLTQSPQSVVSPNTQLMKVYGPAVLISEAVDLGVLRGSRAGLAARQIFSAAFVEHSDPARAYAIAFRDVLPFEDGEGRIPGFNLEN